MFSRIDLSKLDPLFVQKCQKLIEICASKGHTYYAISGFRDPKEQEALYAIGRTTQLDKKPVTNAAPYKSWHNFGMAIDFCHDADATRDGLQPDWKLESYKFLADEAQKLGLEAAYYWTSFKEGPHIQLPRVITTDELKHIALSGSLEKAWAEVHARLKAHARYKAYWI